MGGRCQHLQIEALRSQLTQWEGAAWRHALADPSSVDRAAVISSGCPALDRILPEHGFRRGTLVEWLSSAPGGGAATLAFRAAAEALRMADEACDKGTVPFLLTQKSEQSPRGAVVVLDPSGEFYPPAAIAQGIEPSRLIVVHPGNQADHAWALDQALRCPAVAATVAWPENAPHDVACVRRSSRDASTRAFRRWQLAAEQGGGVGLLIRPAVVRNEPSWADVRLLVEPLVKGTRSPLLPRRLRVVLLRGRGGYSEQTVEVEIDDEPYRLS